MMPFLLLAAGMVLLALALVLVPLLRKSTAEAPADTNLTVLSDALRELESEHVAGRIGAADYQSAHTELQRRALQAQHEERQRATSVTRNNWGAALATAISLPLITVLLYVAVGTPGALHPQATQPTAAGAENPHASDAGAIAALEQRMAANADDVQGWVLLARSYAQTRRFAAAADAYAKAAALDADNPDLLIEYANALAISHDRDLSGEPEQLVRRALKIDPEHPDALAFAGLAAFQRDDRAQALTYWRRLEGLLSPGSEDRTRIELFIARAQTNDTATDAAPPQAAIPGEQKGIRGSVTIAPDLAARVTKGDTLFIFARATGGPPMPIAAVRTQAGTWPVNFTLDDSSAMAAGAALSHFANVNIVARVSRSGSATAEPGDIEGTVGNVAVGSQGVHVVMDRVVER